MNEKEKILFRAVTQQSDLDANAVIGLFAPTGDDDLDSVGGDKPNLNVTDEKGYTLLHYAVKRGLFRTLKRLLEKGARLDVMDKDFYTPLVYAIMQLPQNKNEKSLDYLDYTDQHKIIELLVNHGSDITACGKYELTCLHLAVEKNDYQTLKILVANRTDFSCLELTDNVVRQTPLHKAAKQGSIFIVNYLLNIIKVNPNFKSPLTGSTALHCAAESNQPEIVALLIKAGADINAKNNWDETALQLAREKKYDSVVKILEKPSVELGSVNVLSKSSNSNSLPTFNETKINPITKHQEIYGKDNSNTTQYNWLLAVNLVTRKELRLNFTAEIRISFKEEKLLGNDSWQLIVTDKGKGSIDSVISNQKNIQKITDLMVNKDVKSLISTLKNLDNSLNKVAIILEQAVERFESKVEQRATEGVVEIMTKGNYISNSLFTKQGNEKIAESNNLSSNKDEQQKEQTSTNPSLSFSPFIEDMD